MTDTPLSDDVVERVGVALEKAMFAHGTNDNTYIAPEDAQALGRAALEAARYGEMVDALVDLLPWAEKRPHAAPAINKARALLSSIGASQP